MRKEGDRANLMRAHRGVCNAIQHVAGVQAICSSCGGLIDPPSLVATLMAAKEALAGCEAVIRDAVTRLVKEQGNGQA